MKIKGSKIKQKTHSGILNLVPNRVGKIAMKKNDKRILSYTYRRRYFRKITRFTEFNTILRL